MRRNAKIIGKLEQISANLKDLIKLRCEYLVLCKNDKKIDENYVFRYNFVTNYFKSRGVNVYGPIENWSEKYFELANDEFERNGQAIFDKNIIHADSINENWLDNIGINDNAEVNDE